MRFKCFLSSPNMGGEIGAKIQTKWRKQNGQNARKISLEIKQMDKQIDSRVALGSGIKIILLIEFRDRQALRNVQTKGRAQRKSQRL